jgi:hypothetical protein
MQPITFRCEETLPLPSEDIARQILDLDKWRDFSRRPGLLCRRRCPRW